MNDSGSFLSEWALCLAFIVGCLYLTSLVVFVLTARPQHFLSLGSPEDIKSVINLTPESTYVVLYGNIDSAYRHNVDVLYRKSGWLELLFGVVMLETVFVICIAIIASVFT